MRRYLLHNLDAAASSFVNNQSYIPSVSSVTSRMSYLWSYVSGSSSSPVNNNNNNNNNELDIEQHNDTTGWYSWMPIATFSVIGKDLELPIINSNYQMKKHNFVYGLGVVDQPIDNKDDSVKSNDNNNSNDQQQEEEQYQRPTYWNSIVKLNINNKAIEAKWFEHGCYPSEAVFIPKKSNSTEEKEDDGVLVSVVLDTNRQVSFLLVLDAESLKLVAKCDLDVIVPISFSRGSYKLR